VAALDRTRCGVRGTGASFRARACRRCRAIAVTTTQAAAHDGMPPGDAGAALLLAMQQAHAREPSPDWATRADRLRRLAAMVRDNVAAIAQAIDADFGCRPAAETELLEVFPSLSGIRHALR